jgi:heat shock protein HslJ
MNKILTLLLILPLMSSCGIHKTIYVADSYAICNNSKSNNCLRIKETIKDDWMVLPEEGVEGFDYKEGIKYKIEVIAKKIKNATENKSSLKYKLVKIIYEEKSKPSQELVNFNGDWKVSKLTGLDSLSVTPTLKIDVGSKKIAGNAGCNSYGVDFSIDKNQLKFGVPIATKMYCTNMKIENAFFDCLQKSTYYKLVDGKLILYAKDGTTQMVCSKIEN